MPPNTNEFQKLVFLVKRHAMPGSRVTESAMLLDYATGEKREVDICVETLLGGHTMRLAFECCASKRPPGAPWVEEMVAKHRDLRTNKLVLCSERGFRQTAIKKAKHHGADVLVLEKLDDSTIKQVLAGANELKFQLTTRYAPERTAIYVRRHDGDPVRQVVPPDTCLFATYNGICGEVAIRELAWTLLQTRPMLEELVARAAPEHTWIRFGLHCRCHVREEASGELVEVTQIEADARVDIQASSFVVRHARLGEHEVAWGEPKLNERSLVFVASRDPTGQLLCSVSELPVWAPARRGPRAATKDDRPQQD